MIYKTTLVLGASTDPNRYSNMAVLKLQAHHIPVIAIGKVAGDIGTIPIQTKIDRSLTIHTVSLYLNTAHQEQFYEEIISLKPQRIIFNPGTENPYFEAILTKQGLEVLRACTLVMLSTNSF
ncbi:MAG: CoA-binding protein [Alphaproteobacteria bacterium]|nr:CoA-binding protein [Alphaproteobacteria bacterium]